jgi:hypothetical protein
MVELSDYSNNKLKGGAQTTPVNPLYYIFDVHYFDATGVWWWTYTIPRDIMSYALVSFYMIADELTWHVAVIAINEEIVFYQNHIYPIKWLPSTDRTVYLHAGDKIDIGLAHIASNPHYYWWCMDFWREPVG